MRSTLIHSDYVVNLLDWDWDSQMAGHLFKIHSRCLINSGLVIRLKCHFTSLFSLTSCFRCLPDSMDGRTKLLSRHQDGGVKDVFMILQTASKIWQFHPFFSSCHDINVTGSLAKCTSLPHWESIQYADQVARNWHFLSAVHVCL